MANKLVKLLTSLNRDRAKELWRDLNNWAQGGRKGTKPRRIRVTPGVRKARAQKARKRSQSRRRMARALTKKRIQMKQDTRTGNRQRGHR